MVLVLLFLQLGFSSVRNGHTTSFGQWNEGIVCGSQMEDFKS